MVRAMFCAGRIPSNEKGSADELPGGFEWRQLPPLRVVIMSATLDAGVFLRFLGGLRLPEAAHGMALDACSRLRKPHGESRDSDAGTK